MGNHNKFIVLLAVFCLLAVPCAVISTNGESNDVVTIESDKTVTLDISKDFEGNKEQLKILGIEDSSKWIYDSENKCYQLELNNISFTTTAGHGIVLTSSKENVNNFVLKVIGESSIKSGSVLTDEDPDADAIAAFNPLNMGAFKLTITGGGVLTAVNDLGGKNMRTSAGISVEGTLVVNNGTVVRATSSDMEIVCDGQHTEVAQEVMSVGLAADKLIVTSGSLSQPCRITATGGDVHVTYEKDSIASAEYFESYGLSCPYIQSYGGRIAATSGDVTLTIPEGKKTADAVISTSIGLNMTDGYTDALIPPDFDAYFADGKIKAISGDAVGITRATSKGATFMSDDKIVFDDMVLMTRSGDATCLAVRDKNFTTAYGVEFYSVVELNKTLLSGVGGEVKGAKYNFSLGSHGKKDIYLNGSIVNTSGNNVGFCTIVKMGTKDFNHVYINDSEIYTHGGVRAMNCDPEKVHFTSTDWRYFVAIDKDGNVTELDGPTHLPDVDNKYIKLAYKYDLLFSMNNIDGSNLGISSFARYDSNLYIIPGLNVPNGVKVDKVYFNGEEASIGQLVVNPGVSVLDYEITQYDVDDHNGLIVGIAIVAVLSLVLLALIFKP